MNREIHVGCMYLRACMGACASAHAPGTLTPHRPIALADTSRQPMRLAVSRDSNASQIDRRAASGNLRLVWDLLLGSTICRRDVPLNGAVKMAEDTHISKLF